MDWLEKNQDKDIDTVRAESSAATNDEAPAAAPEAKSYVCNECGKKFRGMAQVQWHGNKSCVLRVSKRRYTLYLISNSSIVATRTSPKAPKSLLPSRRKRKLRN
jgi:hypothetical protein